MSRCFEEENEFKKHKRKHREDKHHEEKDEHEDAVVVQEGIQKSVIEQESDELVWIKNSCNVEVQSTDTQAAVSLQVGLQLAIALVVSITIGDSDEGESVAQELFQQFDAEQTNKQKILVENSKDVKITTTDTDLAVNIQALLQVLVALVVKLDVL
ncbi:spore coat protein [Domibacillus sp. DTU_2020_1001157_1_SI_ALB_TIR_016]|uniref:spore coat protein n=1 Tax=Domibacillus sp. DTU_2020_1001157_1_SI_ALB_TIR_016 TaxID=3077789 RepID=UPI0028E187E0|nr:spore coat protein [Domibacillus sp. DTU_2020_1001157_1_SI_ALB_TIR_016]WNS78105.1 spore coat protein [Domibacillus sp. DTU_2020_1001157_1_SI_ALB_TIR_016]